MTSLLKEELDKIGDYELVVEERAIRSKEEQLGVDICNVIKVASVLNKYGINYQLDKEYNFTILG